MSENAKHSQNIKKPIYKKWWFWVLIVIALLIVIGVASSGDSNNTESPKVVESEPEFEPLILTGKGINVTSSFEIYKGKYEVQYEFSNNLGTYGSGTNFISDVKCDNSSIGLFSLTNLIDAEGSGVKILDITSTKDTCYFEVSNASTNADWSFTVTRR